MNWAAEPVPRLVILQMLMAAHDSLCYNRIANATLVTPVLAGARCTDRMRLKHTLPCTVTVSGEMYSEATEQF